MAFGTGFAGARAMGAKPSTWAFLRDYVRAFRDLLGGDSVDWNGSRMQMMHPAGFAPPRPIDIPVLISALGSKGLAVANDLADGLFTVNGETGFARQFRWTALGVHGTVLQNGEPLDSDRVRAAAGPGNALAYHATHEFGGDVTALPAGDVWLDAINQTPESQRHLAIYDQHLVDLNDADAQPGRRGAGSPSRRPPSPAWQLTSAGASRRGPYPDVFARRGQSDATVGAQRVWRAGGKRSSTAQSFSQWRRARPSTDAQGSTPRPNLDGRQ